MKSYCEDNGISYSGKMTYLYGISVQNLWPENGKELGWFNKSTIQILYYTFDFILMCTDENM